MNKEELKQKYGNAMVLGIDTDTVTNLLENEKNSKNRNSIVKAIDNDELYEILNVLQHNLRPRLRYEAEKDTSFKQIIPYALLRHIDTGKIYTTKRIGGDERLKGMYSIGLGGHMDESETIIDCLLRELNEEVGLVDTDIDTLRLYGYLYNNAQNATEVDMVHLGILYIIETHNANLYCQEQDKLIGEWLSIEELRELRDSGKLESWSEMLFDSIVNESQD